ncbi:hypothetical protein HDU76_005016, partial [Blyttiomyces sp. JEL0837]
MMNSMQKKPYSKVPDNIHDQDQENESLLPPAYDILSSDQEIDVGVKAGGSNSNISSSSSSSSSSCIIDMQQEQEQEHQQPTYPPKPPRTLASSCSIIWGSKPSAPLLNSTDFLDTIKQGYTIVDKTIFIAEALDSTATVNLIARPKGFGKSFNLSMLKQFFEPTENAGDIEAGGFDGELNKKELFMRFDIGKRRREIDELQTFEQIQLRSEDVSQETWSNSLRLLSIWLTRFHGGN